jgi:hypothetical protein
MSFYKLVLLLVLVLLVLARQQTSKNQQLFILISPRLYRHHRRCRSHKHITEYLIFHIPEPKESNHNLQQNACHQHRGQGHGDRLSGTATSRRCHWSFYRSIDRNFNRCSHRTHGTRRSITRIDIAFEKTT